NKSEGGENLNLIFKILKRGDKLDKAIASEAYDALSDMGLRYDLTLPLSRYYANNCAELVLPFKTIQIDRVYRAERPQKGRMREFIQCDIDILGSESSNCEIELIYTTAKALLAIDIGGFRIKVNDRRLLKSVLLNMGFEPEVLDSVCIVFDKLDKIGADGVSKELADKGYDAEAVKAFEAFIQKGSFSLNEIKEIIKEEDVYIIDELSNIIDSSRKLSGDKYEVVFDISLVRGQGYYTGTIFEVESTSFRGAIAGGGRYDNLIGKFIGKKVPAVGFSIGFERIFAILSENNDRVDYGKKRIALFYNTDEYTEAVIKADELRKEYDVSMFEKPKKLGKFLNKIEAKGYYGFVVYGESDEIKAMGE
ncbi:MAG: histidine--tRNA ligase, partial [Lachnospiraceae bacterium]|nr:histidine--tRNA ligase [Lachnospiraceae bacterium]